MAEKSLYYDFSRVLSYKRFLNFIEGSRGAGKTYGLKKLVIRDFLQNASQFIWVRRYDDEKIAFSEFFNDLSEEFPEHEMKFEGGKFKLRKRSPEGEKNKTQFETMGYGIILSKALYRKGSPFPAVRTVIFDEYVIPTGAIHYIPSEPERFLDLMTTIFRDRGNGRVFLVSNSISITNPYWIYFNLVPKRHGITTFSNHPDILIERIENTNFKNYMKTTAIGRLTAGTKYSDYSIDNAVLEDNNEFIAPKTDWARYIGGLRFTKNFYGVWYDDKNGILYINKSYDLTGGRCWCVTRDDMTPNVVLIQSSSQAEIMRLLKLSFTSSAMYFSDAVVKNQICEMMGYISAKYN